MQFSFLSSGHGHHEECEDQTGGSILEAMQECARNTRCSFSEKSPTVLHFVLDSLSVTAEASHVLSQLVAPSR